MKQKKYLVLVLLMVLSFVLTSPVEASLCRNIDDRLICILSIKRSAKYYWEYRAAVSVDGVTRPIEIYNCRDRIRIQKDGTPVPFDPNGAGKLICRFFKK